MSCAMPFPPEATSSREEGWIWKTSRFPPRYSSGSYMYDGIREPCMKTPQEAGESSVIATLLRRSLTSIDRAEQTGLRTRPRDILRKKKTRKSHV
jgi:hypothetical protein